MIRPQEKEEKEIKEHLRANGWVRKKVAKDGACLFRAFAELHYYSQVCVAALLPTARWCSSRRRRLFVTPV